MLSSRFLHLIPHDQSESDKYSLFQGFSQPILRIAPVLSSILALPPDLVELYIPHRNALTMRVRGGYGYHIVPFQYDALDAVPLGRAMPFIIIHSDEETFEWVTKFVTKLEQPVLHVSNVRAPSVIFRPKLSRRILRKYAHDVYEWLEPQASQIDSAKLRSFIEMRPERFSRAHPLRPAQHFATLPNELALLSVGFRLANPDPLPTFEVEEADDNEILAVDDRIFARVIRSAKAVQDIRNTVLGEPSILGAPTVDLIIAAPALYKFHYMEAARLPGDQTLKEALKAARLITRLSTIRTSLPQEDAAILNTAIARRLMVERNRELAVFATSVAIKSASSLAPTLRLPPAVNLIRNELGMIGSCARGNNPHKAWKLERLAGRAIEKIGASVPSGYLHFLSGWNKAIKLYTDVPLEWMRIDGLPLMIRHKVSRIPCTPGNTMNLMALNTESRHIEVQNVARVLVVRSFLPTEHPRLRNALEVTLIERHLRDLVTFVDVSSVDGFVEALNKDDYSILVFDGHGSHSEKTDLGGLIIGGEPINIWSLRMRLNLPPIVMLSACDTHPIDASHASTANGLFAAGCVTVLATLMPVNAIYSADFIATVLDLLFRLVRERGEVFRFDWNELVTYAQRKIYFDELNQRMTQVLNRPSIDIDDPEKIDEPQYCERRLSALAKRWDLSAVAIEQFVSRQFRYTECMNYIQMGNPETVDLCSPEYMRIWQERFTEVEQRLVENP